MIYKSIPTSRLYVGDVVQHHGMRLLIDEPLQRTSHVSAIGKFRTFATLAKVLNRDELSNKQVPYAFTERGHGKPHRYMIQGNDLARWSVEAS